MKIIFRTDIAGAAADVTSVKLADPTAAYGVRMDGTDAVVVAAGADMTKAETGRYEYTLPVLTEGAWHTYCIEWVFGGETHHVYGTFVSPRLSATSDVLLHTPAEIIRAHLLAKNIGTSYLLGTDWATYVSYEPESDSTPNDIIVVYDTTPLKDARLSSGQVAQHYGISINVRALEKKSAWNKVQAIFAELAGLLRQDVDCEGYAYRIPCATVSGPVDLGQEPGSEGRKRRYYYSINVLVPIEHME